MPLPLMSLRPSVKSDLMKARELRWEVGLAEEEERGAREGPLGARETGSEVLRAREASATIAKPLEGTHRVEAAPFRKVDDRLKAPHSQRSLRLSRRANDRKDDSSVARSRFLDKDF